MNLQKANFTHLNFVSCPSHIHILQKIEYILYLMSLNRTWKTKTHSSYLLYYYSMLFFEVIKLCNVASTKFETIYLKNKYILKIFSYIFSHFAFLDQKNPKSLTKFYGQKIQMIMRYSLHLVNKYRGTGFFHRHCHNLTDFPPDKILFKYKINSTW